MDRQVATKLNCDLRSEVQNKKPTNSYGSIVIRRALYRIMLDPMITPNLSKNKSLVKSFASSEKDIKSDIERILENLEPLKKRKLRSRK